MIEMAIQAIQLDNREFIDREQIGLIELQILQLAVHRLDFSGWPYTSAHSQLMKNEYHFRITNIDASPSQRLVAVTELRVLFHRVMQKGS